MANPSQYGVTDPISVTLPTERDLKMSETLTMELKAQKNFPSDEDKAKKDKILADFKLLLRRMIRMVGEKKGLPTTILDVAGGEVYAYGSHRLGVFQNGSDVDTLMVAPKHVTREDFFEYMPKLLLELEDVTEPNAVPGISVPIIKVDVRGVDIDLIFCSLKLSSIPENLDLNDTNLLRGLDMTDVRCLNGTRVTNRILQLVPHTSTFRLALRAIKLWANRRALYGNIVGFPGGVAYAMMVARVCQLYPKAAAPNIIQKFFYIMNKWNWPAPVRLQHQEESNLPLRQWDPNMYRGDALHLMPVLTPAFPVANSTHTITESTKKVMLRELDRGHTIVDNVLNGSAKWAQLFERHTFFTSTYKHFICVITASKNEAEQKSWTGHVLSKLKFLANGMVDSDRRSVEVVQPYNKGFDRMHECKSSEEVEKTLDGDLSCQITETKTTEQTNKVKVQAAAQEGSTTDHEEVSDPEGPQKIYTTTYYLGIGLSKGASALDLSSTIQDFKKICFEWMKFDENMHSVRIKYMKNFDLPADVFVEGEVRPTRAKKAKGIKSAAPANNKRNITQAGLDESADGAKRHQTAKTNGSSLHHNGTLITPTSTNTSTPAG